MKWIWMALAALLLTEPVWAQSFPIEVSADFGGLAPVLEYTSHTSGQTAIITVINNSDQTVSCQGTFKNGPETVRSKRTTIKAGEKGNLFNTAQRTINKMRVELQCAPAQ